MTTYKILAIDIGSANIDSVKDKLIGQFTEAQYIGRHNDTNMYLFVLPEDFVNVFLGNVENIEYDDVSVDSVSDVGKIVHNG